MKQHDYELAFERPLTASRQMLAGGPRSDVRAPLLSDQATLPVVTTSSASSLFFEYATRTRGRFISIVTPELEGANAAFKSRLHAANVSLGTQLAEGERVTLIRTRLSHADAAALRQLEIGRAHV